MIDTSNWLGGKWVAVSPASVTGIEWAKQSVTLRLTQDEIKNSPSLEEATCPHAAHTTVCDPVGLKRERPT